MKLTVIPSKTWMLSGIEGLERPVFMTISSPANGSGRLAFSYRHTTWAFDSPFPEQRHGERPHEWAARIHPIVLKRMMREQQPATTKWNPAETEAILGAVQRACTAKGIFG